MMLMHRREFVRYAGFAGLVGLGTVPGAFAAADQAGAEERPDRGRRAELLRHRRHAAGQGRRARSCRSSTSSRRAFENVVVTQDWHTPGHVSFASAHAGKKPFETTKLAYGTQVLWPDHCVQGSEDAALLKGLTLPKAQLIIRKGYHQGTDSYSAFTEADGKTTTGLAAYLKAHGVDTRLRLRPGDRFLRRLDRARCAQGRLQGLGDRGRVARHRPQRLAQGGLGQDDQGRRQAHPVERHRASEPSMPRGVAQPFACRRAAQ